MTAGLDIGDPFHFLERQAGAFVSRCNFPRHFIPEAIDILRAAFDEDWIREQVAKKVPEGSYRAPKHPLARRISTSSKADVAELLELAMYIKRLVKVPRLDKVINHMKNPTEYRPSFLQLAYAYRFQSIGATDLILEPTAEGGRFGDLAFKIGDRGVIAECYIPQPDYEDPLEEMRYSHSKISKAITGSPKKPIIAKFRFKTSITPAQRKQIETQYFRMIRDVDADPLTFSNECVDLEIERTSKAGIDALAPVPRVDGRLSPATDATNVLFVKSATEDEIRNLRIGESDSRDYAGAILIWAPPGSMVPKDVISTINKVAENTRQKLSQTRSRDFPLRMVLLEIPEALNRNGEVMNAMLDFQGQLREHDGFSSAWVVSRVWKTDLRHGYRGYHLQGKVESALPEQVFKDLFDLEATGDVLSEQG